MSGSTSIYHGVGERREERRWVSEREKTRDVSGKGKPG
jgi:hypothetical protein